MSQIPLVLVRHENMCLAYNKSLISVIQILKNVQKKVQLAESAKISQFNATLHSTEIQDFNCIFAVTSQKIIVPSRS